jgi:hypothetical protein
VVYKNLFCSAYIFYVRPFTSKRKNYLEMLNEYGIFVASVSLMTFSEWVPRPEDQSFIGWYLIGITIAIILINIGDSLMLTIKETC